MKRPYRKQLGRKKQGLKIVSFNIDNKSQSRSWCLVVTKPQSELKSQ
jgi:hypothetical protein